MGVSGDFSHPPQAKASTLVAPISVALVAGWERLVAYKRPLGADRRSGGCPLGHRTASPRQGDTSPRQTRDHLFHR